MSAPEAEALDVWLRFSPEDVDAEDPESEAEANTFPDATGSESTGISPPSVS